MKSYSAPNLRGPFSREELDALAEGLDPFNEESASRQLGPASWNPQELREALRSIRDDVDKHHSS